MLFCVMVYILEMRFINQPPHEKTNNLHRQKQSADQLCSNWEADQRLCFRYMDGTIPLLSESKISRLQPSSVLVQLSLCQTWSETTVLVFPRGGSNNSSVMTWQGSYFLTCIRIFDYLHIFILTELFHGHKIYFLSIFSIPATNIRKMQHLIIII